MIRKTVRRSIGKQERLRNITKSQLSKSIALKHALNSNFVRLAYVEGLKNLNDPSKTKPLQTTDLRGIYDIPAFMDKNRRTELSDPHKAVIKYFGVARIYADKEAAKKLIEHDAMEKIALDLESNSWDKNVLAICSELKIKAIIDKGTNSTYFMATKENVALFALFDPNSSDFIDSNNCPSTAELRRFSSTSLNGKTGRIEKHMATCQRCNDLVGEIWSGNKAGKLGKIDLEV
jgi:hypothetical protein